MDSRLSRKKRHIKWKLLWRGTLKLGILSELSVILLNTNMINPQLEI